MQKNQTLFCLLGAEAYYGGVPVEIIAEVRERVPAELWSVIEKFSERYAVTREERRPGL